LFDDVFNVLTKSENQCGCSVLRALATLSDGSILPNFQAVWRKKLAIFLLLDCATVVGLR